MMECDGMRLNEMRLDEMRLNEMLCFVVVNVAVDVDVRACRLAVRVRG